MTENMNKNVLNVENIIEKYIDDNDILNHRELAEYIIKSISTMVNNTDKNIHYDFIINENTIVNVNADVDGQLFYMGNDLLDELPLVIISIRNNSVLSRQKYVLFIGIKENKFYLYNWKHIDYINGNIKSVNGFCKDNEVLTENFIDIVNIASNFIYNSLEETKKEHKKIISDFNKILYKGD